MNFDKNLIKEPDERLVYKEINGLELPMNVYYPVGGLKEKNICVLCVHGGSWRTDVKKGEKYTSSWMDMSAKYYAQAGYVGIAISYRNIDDENTTVTDLIEDCFDAMRYIKRNLDYVDNDKIIAIGDSAGGHLVSCMGVCQDDEIRPEIVIACNPVLDCTKEKWKDCDTTYERKRNASPLHNVGEKLSKFLCMHGDCDNVVPIGDTLEFSEKLKKAGTVSEMIVEKGASHAFILFDYLVPDEKVIEYMEQTMNFIKENI